jgi:hypothetical protein
MVIPALPIRVDLVLRRRDRHARRCLRRESFPTERLGTVPSNRMSRECSTPAVPTSARHRWTNVSRGRTSASHYLLGTTIPSDRHRGASQAFDTPGSSHNHSCGAPRLRRRRTSEDHARMARVPSTRTRPEARHPIGASTRCRRRPLLPRAHEDEVGQLQSSGEHDSARYRTCEEVERRARVRSGTRDAAPHRAAAEGALSCPHAAARSTMARSQDRAK